MAVVHQIKVPLIAVNDTSLTVVGMPFQNGALVAKGSIVLVFETSKTTYDVVAEADGYIQYSCRVDEDYEVNTEVACIYSAAEEVQENLPAVTQSVLMPSPGVNQDLWEGTTIFSTVALQLMQQHRLEPTLFKGRDFVNKLDVERLLGIASEFQIPAETKVAKKISTLSQADPEKIIAKKITGAKKKEIEFLSAVQSHGLTSTINTYVQTDGLFVHINQSLQYLKDSLLPVIIYETARLLQKYGELNAYFTGDAVARYKLVNVGFAVDIDKGLKVLRIEQAADKSISAIEDDILALSGKYLDDTLQVSDLTEISFTITDLSAEGVAFFTPLVNMMNSAILGISAIDEQLNRCVLSLTFDHRVTEGKTVARFLSELKARVESYRSVSATHNQNNVHCFKCFKSLADDLSDVGFSKCVTPAGEDAYICQSCFKGF